MSDYFFNLSDFCSPALYWEKQASVQAFGTFNGNWDAYPLCRKSDRDIYRCNFADKCSVAFSFCNRRNTGSDTNARS